MIDDASRMSVPDWASCTEEELWEYVASHLKAHGIDTVLVGGAVVAIYTGGIYRSGDLDLVPETHDRKEIASVLKAIGFVKSGRHFIHPDCAHLFIEFPPGPVALGDDYQIRPAERIVDGQVIRLLSPTDCVKDRLASYIHWKTRDCPDQAILVARHQAVDLDQIKAWCGIEGGDEAFREIEAALKRG
jgi:hypothetical protein